MPNTINVVVSAASELLSLLHGNRELSSAKGEGCSVTDAPGAFEFLDSP
jgi:hypothetical protein